MKITGIGRGQGRPQGGFRIGEGFLDKAGRGAQDFGGFKNAEAFDRRQHHGAAFVCCHGAQDLGDFLIELASGQLVHDRFIECAEQILALGNGLSLAQHHEHLCFGHGFNSRIARASGPEKGPRATTQIWQFTRYQISQE
jgi:hypothetical protein